MPPKGRKAGAEGERGEGSLGSSLVTWDFLYWKSVQEDSQDRDGLPTMRAVTGWCQPVSLPCVISAWPHITCLTAAGLPEAALTPTGPADPPGPFREVCRTCWDCRTCRGGRCELEGRREGGPTRPSACVRGHGPFPPWPALSQTGLLQAEVFPSSNEGKTSLLCGFTEHLLCS